MHGRQLRERPVFTLDPLWHAGLYYVQESSSMFVGWILSVLFGDRKDLACLDMCAAPGGKSLNILNHLQGSGILVSNEPVAQRNVFLRENIAKWGAANCLVTKGRPAEIAAMGALFDLVLVDAPCSGEGMFRKDSFAREQWSESLVIQCATEQENILSEAWKALKPGGYLVYSTCTFSPQENEDRLDQLLSFSSAEAVRLEPGVEWNIVEVPTQYGWMYRFLPHLQSGEGLTIGVVRKSGEATNSKLKKPKNLRACKDPEWDHWVKSSDQFQLFSPGSGEEYLLSSSDAVLRVAPLCLENLYVTMPGLHVGTRKGKDLVPGHALAISPYLSDSIRRIPLERSEALRFLRCESVDVPADTKGWYVVTYQGYALGWIKSIPPRVNNYFPREWKIRMQGD
jgi:NOL1/NOP2/fmu family ribosome biogenesis protein